MADGRQRNAKLDELASELAKERMENDIGWAQEGGVPYSDIVIEDYLPEAMEFVLRCVRYRDHPMNFRHSA